MKSQETTLDAKRTKLLNFIYGCFSKEIAQNPYLLFFLYIAFYLLYICFSMLALLDSTVRGVCKTRAMKEDMVLAMCIGTSAQAGKVFFFYFWQSLRDAYNSITLKMLMKL